jgi:flavin reductase (DIM6/NTAB) family NADH-FMN oxidoreductase RutF
MDLPWGDPRSNAFMTNVGLITSDGPHGQNIMAAEWTHHISYKPGLIAVNIHPTDATAENIEKTKEFGVNLCAADQNVASSIAGGSTGREVDKIKVLKELGVEFYPARKIRALMVKGAALNAECRLVQAIPLGDHTMFVGEVLEASVSGRPPLAYHDGKYWKVGERIPKPGQDVLDRIQKLVGKHRKA